MYVHKTIPVIHTYVYKINTTKASGLGKIDNVIMCIGGKRIHVCIHITIL